VNLQKPDYIITTTYSLKVAKDILKVKGNAKTIMESHISHDSVIRHYDFKKNDINRLIFKFYDNLNLRTLQKYDAFISLTKKDASQWEKSGIKVKVIPNPVTEYPSTVEMNKTCNYRIIAVGRLNHQKGFDRLITAFSLISKKQHKWKVDIFGQGELEGELNRQITDYNLQDRITIHQPTKEIFKEYLRSDFFVLSSNYEGFGLVLIEAMSCGIPVLSYDCPYGPNEIITDGYDGLLVENGNIQQLSQKMEWLIEHEEERRRMGTQARLSAKRYEIHHVMTYWEELFQNGFK
jgi:glycosyltransferase involved in cell wall biosynthesis